MRLRFGMLFFAVPSLLYRRARRIHGVGHTPPYSRPRRYRPVLSSRRPPMARRQAPASLSTHPSRHGEWSTPCNVQQHGAPRRRCHQPPPAARSFSHGTDRRSAPQLVHGVCIFYLSTYATRHLRLTARELLYVLVCKATCAAGCSLPLAAVHDTAPSSRKSSVQARGRETMLSRGAATAGRLPCSRDGMQSASARRSVAL